LKPTAIMDNTKPQAIRLATCFEAADVPDPEHNLDLGATFLRLAGLVKRNGATAAWRG
jgi:hypothetical protein